MQMKSILGTVIAAMMLGAPAALAQNTPAPSPAAQNRTQQPATGGGATQSAPAESPHASGHDAQSGKPETGPNAARTQGAASEDYKNIHGTQNKK
ncbi:putative protein OS=Afipia felis OX=1035 GN=BN961_01140 PE=4 SV=1 [Afipia felis]